jgi:DNA mismatch repair protein MSH5
MKACRDFSMFISNISFRTKAKLAIVLTSGGTFQIRPSKEFHAARGLDRLLTLPLLSNFSSDSFNSASSVSETMSESGRSEPRNAYDFMMRRKQSGDASADPTASRWNASIRLGNFGTADSPLCVGHIFLRL